MMEWGFLGLLALLCAGLAALQFRWTGELGRAERLRLQTSLNEQLRRVGSVFDTELLEACTDLMPTTAELDELGPEMAHASRVQRWNATGPSRQLFKKVAVAVPHGDELDLLALDVETGALRDEPWPVEWDALREDFLARPLDRDEPEPRIAAGSPLIEFPIFEPRPAERRPPPGGGFDGFPPDRPPERRPPREREWMIFELNLEHVTRVWLPMLIKTHLNTGPKPDYDVEVRANDGSKSVIFSSNPTAQKLGAGVDGSAQFFAVELPWQTRKNRPADGQPRGRWTLYARHRAGSLEAAVTAARRKNLWVAALLNGLILSAGVALVRYTRRSRQLAETQMKFVANVSHELRTPLTVIRGAGHNLERGIVREPAQIEQYAGLIVKHAEQLTAMVEQVLAYASATHAQSTEHYRAVSIEEILHDCIAATTPETEAAACKVEVSIAHELPPVIGDAAALRRVFQNLIVNAARHGGSGQWIGIAATLGAGETVKIQVSDSGPGIPENERAKVFQPFFRGASTEARQIRGSGIGLSLVREVVAAHGGSISVHCESGRGTTFTVRLPIARSDAAK